jgi:hypothetical protein
MNKKELIEWLIKSEAKDNANILIREMNLNEDGDMLSDIFPIESIKVDKNGDIIISDWP